MNARARDLRRLYGMEPGNYETMLAEQDGRCALCQWQPSSADRVLVVDHDHATGRVRGLLCHDCNLFLGRAEKYLNESTGEVLGMWIQDLWYELPPGWSQRYGDVRLQPTNLLWRDGGPKWVRP